MNERFVELVVKYLDGEELTLTVERSGRERQVRVSVIQQLG